MPTSVIVEDLGHISPIPNGGKRGPLFGSSRVFPIVGEPGKRKPPPNLDDQCELLFANIHTIVRAAGSTPQNIVKMTFFVKDADDKLGVKKKINVPWERMYPFSTARPGRSTMIDTTLPEECQVACEFIAFVPGYFGLEASLCLVGGIVIGVLLATVG